jgi:UrcA family protein
LRRSSTAGRALRTLGRSRDAGQSHRLRTTPRVAKNGATFSKSVASESTTRAIRCETKEEETIMNNVIAGPLSSRAATSAKRGAIAVVGAVVLALTSLSATAASDGFLGRSETVKFKDLDLSKQADTERLYRRLKMAANQVCIGYADSPGMRSPYDRCVQKAIENAVDTIGHPNLTALHRKKSDVRLAQSKSKSVPNS